MGIEDMAFAYFLLCLAFIFTGTECWCAGGDSLTGARCTWFTCPVAVIINTTPISSYCV